LLRRFAPRNDRNNPFEQTKRCAYIKNELIRLQGELIDQKGELIEQNGKLIHMQGELIQ